MNLTMEISDGVMPVIITTAREDAHGSIPVKNPTVIGFSIALFVNFPCSCPQSLIKTSIHYQTK